MKRYTLSLLNNKPLINLAKDHFDRVLAYDHHFQKTWNQQINRGNCIHRPDWQKAFTIAIAGSNGVVIPIQSTNNNTFQNNSIDPSLFVPELFLLITKDYRDALMSEIVTLVPEGFQGTMTCNAFTGYILPGISPVHSLRSLARQATPSKRNGSIGYLAPVVKYDPPAVDSEPNKIHSPGPSLLTSTFSVRSGDNIIGNISDYLKCFDNIPGTDHTYQVKLCVIQPNPGQRDPWAFSSSDRKKSTQNPVFVGHTYLILTAIAPHKSTTRNVGFYPTETVHPYSPVSQGILNNDQAHEYDVALIITLTNSQFFNVLNYIPRGNNQGYNYNLNTNNCTTFAVDALAAAQIIIPRTIGTWTNGKGMNPGDLGEDLKSMHLSSNMKLQTSFNHHPNIGDCQ